MADTTRLYPLLMTTSSLLSLDAIDLRRALSTIAELQDLRIGHGVPTEVSLRQAIDANMVDQNEVFDVILRGGTDAATD